MLAFTQTEDQTSLSVSEGYPSNMLKPQERFFSEGQRYMGPSDYPKTETHCNVWNWDELRMIKVKGTAKVFPPDEDREIPILAQFADYLSPDVRAITVDNDGLLCGISTDPEEDDTWYVPYYHFESIPSLADCRTIPFAKLQEIDRLGPGVDLSSYQDDSGQLQTVVFKFNAFWKPRRLKMAWDELHILKSLPPHPNLVPLDGVVLEDKESRVIGFTTKYIPGGTLADSDVPFRFEWLQQLTAIVDFLNLELGIIHQDVAPRNLLIDPNTHKLLLFDFNWAIRREEIMMEGRDDVSGVVYTLYELITDDTHFTSIPHWDRNIDMVQGKEWTCNRKLDADVSVFRAFLDEWVAKRKAQAMNGPTHAPKQITWPDAPTPPDYNVPFEHGTLPNGEPDFETGPRYRRVAMEKGQYCFRWERPPQCRMDKVEKGVKQ